MLLRKVYFFCNNAVSKIRFLFEYAYIRSFKYNIYMANPFFRFKQFTVWHDQCAMKVGTDGALLGAWVRLKATDRFLLDVGTGSGLIALMMAQRSQALIDAIDIDQPACQQAAENARRSPFAGRIAVHHKALTDYEPQEDRRYDLIASNPPYFIQSLKCPNAARSHARHADSLTLPSLLADSSRLLASQGRIALVLPFDQREALLEEAKAQGLYAQRETHVSSRLNLPPKRLLIELGQQPAETLIDSLAIEADESRRYTSEFIALERPYYLKI